MSDHPASHSPDARTAERRRERRLQRAMDRRLVEETRVILRVIRELSLEFRP
jgi:hypothetical protein